MRFNLIPPRHTAASAVRHLAEGLVSGDVVLKRENERGDGLEPGRTTVIRYRCPSCRHIDERPDRDAGRVVACSGCGQSLIVPPAHLKQVALPAEPLPPARKRSWVDWVWRPAPRIRRENSAETLIRVGLNLVVGWFVLYVGFWIPVDAAVAIFAGPDWLARLLAGR